jgi:sterol desaturase/sphingolipid hydroxylase (fatty acid hydroxylase superfamily)
MTWQTLQNFFGEGQNLMQVGLFALVFLICWNLEHIFGVSKHHDYNKWKHTFTNSLFMIPGGLMQLFLGIIFVKVLILENQEGYGLLPKLGFTSNGAQIAITFVFLDLMYWLYHFLMHKVGFAWRFHAVHHSDHVLNVTTSLREHPGETIIRLGHYMLGVWLLGPAFWIVTLHQFIQITSKIIVHSNWRLPDRVDRYVSLLLLTPNMHHVHHHHEQPYTDSNFGDLLSIWDRMFGTFYYLPKDQVVFGLDVDVFDNPSNKDMKFKGLMTVPFSKKNLSND